MTTQWLYRVVKRQRGMRGEWFDHRTAATFSTLEGATDYAVEFARNQRGVVGAKIDVRHRRPSIGTIASYTPER